MQNSVYNSELQVAANLHTNTFSKDSFKVTASMKCFQDSIKTDYGYVSFCLANATMLTRYFVEIIAVIKPSSDIFPGSGQWI